MRDYEPFSESSVTIERWEDGVEVMGSLQRPKKVTVIGSDGTAYSFLCKPKDDLRKDARMMELMTAANRMLAKPHDWEITDARLRQLLVRPLPQADPPPDQLWAQQPHAERLEASTATVERRLSTSTRSSARVSRYQRSRPHRACADEQLLPKWRGNTTITAECVYLFTKYLARQDVRAWHERYRTLRCAIAAGRKSSRVES